MNHECPEFILSVQKNVYGAKTCSLMKKKYARFSTLNFDK